MVDKIKFSRFEAEVKNKLNFNRSKAALLKKIITKLTTNVISTYLGDDVTPKSEQINHFNWCWKKTMSDFENNKFHIEMSGKHYEYFLSYFNKFFYEKRDKTDKNNRELLKFWDFILSLDLDKTRDQYKIQIHVYNIFDNNIIINTI